MEKNLTMRFVVAIAMRREDGRYLLQKRPEGRAMAGLWEFPGGKVEAGESPEAALLREITEELGSEIRAQDCRPLIFASEQLASEQLASEPVANEASENKHLLLLLYHTDIWRGEPQALHAEALRWVLPEEMDDLAMPPADVPFVDRLKEMAAYAE